MELAAETTARADRPGEDMEDDRAYEQQADGTADDDEIADEEDPGYESADREDVPEDPGMEA